MTSTYRIVALAAAVAMLGAAACSPKSTSPATVPASHATVAHTATVGQTATAAGLDAQALYQSLLSTPWQDGELPSTVSSPKVGVTTLSGRQKNSHAVGAVEVDLTGPDSGDGIAFVVFPTAKEAMREWDGGRLTLDSDSKETGTTTPPDVGYPATQANISVTGNNAFGQKVTNGGSLCAAVVGFTLVEGITTSVDNPDSGNVPLSCSLLKAAIAHLKAIESQAG